MKGTDRVRNGVGNRDAIIIFTFLVHIASLTRLKGDLQRGKDVNKILIHTVKYHWLPKRYVTYILFTYVGEEVDLPYISIPRRNNSALRSDGAFGQ